MIHMMIMLLVAALLVTTCVWLGRIPTYKHHSRGRIAFNEAAATTTLTLDALRAMVVELLDLPAETDDATIQKTFDTFGDESAEETKESAAQNERFKAACNALGIPETSKPEELHQAILEVPTKLKASNDIVANERKARAGLLIDVAVNEGRVTEAQRSVYLIAFNSDFEGTASKLKTEAKKINTDTSKISGLGDRKSVVANAQERQAKILAAVNERMEKTGENYDTAFEGVQKDEKYKPLFEAMQKPGQQA